MVHHVLVVVWTGMILFFPMISFGFISTKQTVPIGRTSRLGQSALLFCESIKRGASQKGEEDDTRRIRRVNFIAPLLEYGYKPAVDEYMDTVQKEGRNATTTKRLQTNQKPLLLYLPGFDGTFLSPFLQFPELHTIFDVRCMTVDIADRSYFDELRDGVLQYLETELLSSPSLDSKSKSSQSEATTTELDEVLQLQQPQQSTTPWGSVTDWLAAAAGKIQGQTKPQRMSRPVYLAGESFGGILASEVALTILERNQSQQQESINLQGLTLINAATCFDRSKLAVQGPQVASLPLWLYWPGLVKLLPLFTDDYSVGQLLSILQGKALPSVIDNEAREAYMVRFIAGCLPTGGG